MDWLGDPAHSVGARFGHHGRHLVWSLRSNSPADLAFQSIRRDIHFALREASLEPNLDVGQPLPRCLVFMVGEIPERSVPTILISAPHGQNGYRWRAYVGLRIRLVFNRYPGLAFGDYWPSRDWSALLDTEALRAGVSSNTERIAAPSQVLTLGSLATNPDSGYGSASHLTAKAQNTLDGGDVEMENAPSVATNDLSIAIAQDRIEVYVKTFAERLLADSGLELSGTAPNPNVIQALPGLLRAFALRVTCMEKSANGKAVGTFTRQCKE